MSNFHPLEIVGRGDETSENVNKITNLAGKGLTPRAMMSTIGLLT